MTKDFSIQKYLSLGCIYLRYWASSPEFTFAHSARVIYFCSQIALLLQLNTPLKKQYR